eukprot:490865_1
MEDLNAAQQDAMISLTEMVAKVETRVDNRIDTLETTIKSCTNIKGFVGTIPEALKEALQQTGVVDCDDTDEDTSKVKIHMRTQCFYRTTIVAEKDNITKTMTFTKDVRKPTQTYWTKGDVLPTDKIKQTKANTWIHHEQLMTLTHDMQSQLTNEIHITTATHIDSHKPEYAHPIPVIKNIKCKSITDTKKTIYFDAILPNKRDKNLLYESNSLFMTLSTVNSEIDMKQIECSVIEFNENKQNYEMNVKSLTPNTEYMLHFSFTEKNTLNQISKITNDVTTCVKFNTGTIPIYKMNNLKMNHKQNLISKISTQQTANTNKLQELQTIINSKNQTEALVATTFKQYLAEVNDQIATIQAYCEKMNKKTLGAGSNAGWLRKGSGFLAFLRLVFSITNEISYIIILITLQLKKYGTDKIEGSRFLSDEFRDWFCSLENGRFDKYFKHFLQGCKEQGIKNVLELNTAMLSVHPMNIKIFRDKHDLIQHFKTEFHGKSHIV